MKLANILATTTADAIMELVLDPKKDIVAEAQRQANKTISEKMNKLLAESKLKWIMLDVCGDIVAWTDGIKDQEEILVIDTAKRNPLFYIGKIWAEEKEEGEVLSDNEIKYAYIDKV